MNTGEPCVSAFCRTLAISISTTFIATGRLQQHGLDFAIDFSRIVDQGRHPGRGCLCVEEAGGHCLHFQNHVFPLIHHSPQNNNALFGRTTGLRVRHALALAPPFRDHSLQPDALLDEMPH